MSVYIAGFICAIVLALFVIAWIAYCMFIKERHKSELHQYNISDLQHRNYMLAQEQERHKTEKEAKEVSVGVFVLPSHHKQKDDDFNKRPDYPESPIHMTQPRTDKLIEILNEDDFHYKDGIYEVDAAYQSEV